MPDKKLFTPGPLTTSRTVKEAMLRDLGSRDTEFITAVKEIREQLLEVASVSKEDGFESIIMQGSGTFGIESVISSVIPDDGHLLVIINGTYGERISDIARIHHIPQTRLIFQESEWPCMNEIEESLNVNPAITHVVAVHCETTTGIINPVDVIGKLAAQYNKKYIVDAMSSFGAVPIDLKDAHVDFLISSSNKCIEGVPGFSFIIAKRDTLESTKEYARTLSLDLWAQWKGLESNGQFRFTPPIQVLLAFHQALKELKAEGGIEARAQRYQRNYRILVEEMKKLGFEEYLDREKQGYIITSFYYPDHPGFSFEKFYQLLSDKGQVIYPGKLSKANCFRIGNIGRIYPEDVDNLIDCIRESLKELNIEMHPEPSSV